jgi:hypothetical protein
VTVDTEPTIESLKAENARLNDQIAEWSKANLAIIAKCVSETKRADKAERQLAKARWQFEQSNAARLNTAKTERDLHD